MFFDKLICGDIFAERIMLFVSFYFVFIKQKFCKMFYIVKK